jgi:hypothetical protein
MINNNRRTRAVRYIPIEVDLAELFAVRSGVSASAESIYNIYHIADYREGDLLGFYPSNDFSRAPVFTAYIYRDEESQQLHVAYSDGQRLFPDEFNLLGLSSEEIMARYQLPFKLPLTDEEEIDRRERFEAAVAEDEDQDQELLEDAWEELPAED